MDTEQLTQVLRTTGMSQYQADAYVTLLELGSASARELAETSGVPQPRIYDVLHDLEEDGYIELYTQETQRARVHDLAPLIDDLGDHIQNLQTATHEVEQRWARPSPEEHEVTVVSRFETVLNWTRDFIEEADYHVKLSVTPHEFEQLRSELEAASDRGVYIQLSLHSISEIKPFELEGLSDICTEARVRERPAPYLAIIDQAKGCYALHVDTPHEYGVIINDRNHAYVFQWFYLTMLWALWEPYCDNRPTEPPIQYSEVRRCITAIAADVESGATVKARVQGHWVDGYRECDVTGKIVDVEYEYEQSAVDDDKLTLTQLLGEASFTLETESGEFSVGGTGALVEDIEASRVIVESIANE